MAVFCEYIISRNDRSVRLRAILTNAVLLKTLGYADSDSNFAPWNDPPCSLALDCGISAAAYEDTAPSEGSAVPD